MDVNGRPAGATAGRLAAWLTLVGLLIAANWSARLLVEESARAEGDAFYRWETFWGALVQFTLMLGVVLWIAHRGPARELLAWRRPRSWPQAAGAALLVLIGVIALSALLNPVLQPGEEQGLVPDEFDRERAAPLIANWALTALYVPVVEELAFRGLGFTLLARYGAAVALVVTAVLFGLAHGLLFGLPILVAFGLGLAWLRLHTGSVLPCIVLHGLFNAASVGIGVFVDPPGGS